ncbi:MAG: hypothetical protein ACRD8U_16640 [Pyrinomonadaceae bacterium]
MVNDSTHTELLIEERSAPGSKVVAALCAILLSAALIAGYAYVRRRHNQQVLASAVPAPAEQNVPKGPPKAHILVDEPLLQGGQTIIGGAVKNVSDEKLTSLSVALDLKRRKDGVIEQVSAPVEPGDLDVGQEGRYILKAAAQQYSSVRLVGLKGGLNGAPLAYTTSQGQKRPPERLEPRIVTVPRARGRGEFLNSPDNPASVP